LPRRLRLVLLPLVLLLAAGCRIERNPEPEPRDVSALAREQIGRSRDGLQRALMAGDARAAASHFTADARLSDPVYGEVETAGQVFETFRGFFNDAGAVVDVGLAPDVMDVSGGAAYEFGVYRETRRGPVEHLVSGSYAIKWRRGAEATWRIERMLVSAHPATAAGRAATTPQ
jgi:ketosteroid isomerase-like protein